jgi:hypothetical protein
MFGCDTDIALHPEGELLASFVSDQGATLLRFARAADGRGHGGLEMFDTALIIDVDGYEGLVFSPSGDRFAMMGNAYEVFALVHSFPSLKRELVLAVAGWNDLHRHLPPPWNDYRWTLGERVAFTPDGQSLLLGNFAGDVIVVTLAAKPSLEQMRKTHDGPIGALRTRPHDGMLVYDRSPRTPAAVPHAGAVSCTRHDGSPSHYGLPSSQPCSAARNGHRWPQADRRHSNVGAWPTR